MNQDHADAQLAQTSLAFESPEDEASWLRFIEETAALQAIDDREMEKFMDTGGGKK